MNFTIYAYWNSVELATVLNAIAAMVGGSDYLGLLRSLALVVFIALIVTVLSGKSRTEDFGRWFIMVAFLNGVMLVPKTNVVIVDRTGSAPATTVANVPLGFTALAGTVSHMGDWLTRMEETLFAQPDDVRLSQTGLMFGHRIVRERLVASVANPVLTSNLVEFYRECVWPEIATGYIPSSTITSSEDIWTLLNGVLNPGIYVQYADINNPSSTVTASCPAAYTELTKQINADVEENLARLGRKTYPQMSATLAKATLVGTLQSTSNYMLGTAQGAQAIMRQAIIGNSIINASYEIPAQVGDAAQSAVNLARIQGIRSFNTSNQAMVGMAEDTMPKLRNVIEILIYALFPVVALMVVSFGHQGGTIIKVYLGSLLWVQLWAPLYAILNFCMNIKTSQALTSVTGGEGLALKYYGYVGEAVANDQAVAGVLVLAIPVIAYGITQMTVNMASAIGATNQPAGQFGANLSQGNMQFGSQNVDAAKVGLMTQGQYSTQPTMRGGVATADMAGAYGRETTSGLTRTVTGAFGSYSGVDGNGAGRLTLGELTSFNGGASSVFGSGAAVGSDQYRGSSTFSGSDVKRGFGQENSSGTSEKATLTSQQSAEFSRSLEQSLAKNTRLSNTNSTSNDSSHVRSDSTQLIGQQNLQNAEGLTHRSGLSMRGSGEGNGGGGADGDKKRDLASILGKYASAQTSGDVATANQYLEQATKLSSQMDSRDVRETFSHLRQAVKDTAAGTNDKSVKTAAERIGSALERATTNDNKTVGSMMESLTAGIRNEAGTRNTSSVRGDNSMDLFRTAWTMFGQRQSQPWDDVVTPERASQFAKEWQNNAAFREDAMMAQASGQSGSSILKNGTSAPVSMDEVRAQGVPTVANNVPLANDAYNGVVGEHQHAGPRSQVDTSDVERRASLQQEGVGGMLSSAQGQQNLNQGVGALANAIYNDRQHGAGTVLRNSLGGGIGSASPQQYQQALHQAAQSDPELANRLSTIGANGGKVSKEDMDFVEQRAGQSLADAQGRVSGLLHKLK